MISSKCCGQIVLMTQNAMALNNNISRVLTGVASRMYYSKDRGGNYENFAQTAGKKVEPWPKPDPPPQMWRCECPQDPQPPNYDPYRIKVPDVVVPPMPPSKATWSGEVFTTTNRQNPGQQQGCCQQEACQHQPCQYPYGCQPQGLCEPTPEKDNSFLGLLKGFFGKLTGRGKGRVKPILSEPMLNCAKIKPPCSVPLVPPPPPCPPPPPKPFPWIYLWALITFCGALGLLYRLYLFKEECDKSDENKQIWRPRRKIKRPYHERDLPACVQYLIIGTGAAGWSAYRAIMEHDKRAKVFFVTKEDVVPYRRPPMSKFMWWNNDPPDITKLTYLNNEQKRKTMFEAECESFMDPIKFYRKKRGPAVSIATGWCIVRIDADEHVAYVRTMAGERPIYYERCLLAPGAKARKLEMFKSAPKSVRDRVTTLRTIRDLEIAFRKVKESKHVVIIGGGVLGTELAYHLGRMNKKVLVDEPNTPPIEFVHIYKDDGVMAGVIPAYLGEYAAEKIRCQGVIQMPKTQVYDAFDSPDGRLELTLSNGKSIVTDYAFVAVGSLPREELAEPSELERDHVNGGFLVNTELKARTHLYVAGDAASFYSQWKDERKRFEHYNNAVEQGYIAGANMTGYWIPCNMEQHFEVILGDDLNMEVVGEAGGCMPTVGLFKECDVDKLIFTETEREKGAADRKCFKQGGEYEARYKHGLLFYLQDEIVVGFVFWNMVPRIEDRLEVATELLRARPSYKDIDVLAELLGFKDARCVYRKPPVALCP